MATFEPEVLYSKQLTQSDAACSKQIKLPRNEAKKFVGDLRHKQSAALVVKDAHDVYWEFICTCYGCQYALSKVGAFAKAFNLKPGDTLSFFRDENNELRIAVNHHLTSGNTTSKPRSPHTARKKRPSLSDDGSPSQKSQRCTVTSSMPTSPKEGFTPAADVFTDVMLHEQLSFAQLQLPVSFSGSASSPSSPLGQGAMLQGALAGHDLLRRGADAPWHTARPLDQQQLDSLHAVLLLQTLDSLNSGPALFKRPEPSPPCNVRRPMRVTLPLSPIQVPDSVSPVKQLNSPYDKSPGRTDHSNLSEDTQGHLDVLEDSTAGCSTPEPSPTSPTTCGSMRKTLVLCKQLSRMDVRCAHDPVGITFSWEDVASARLIDSSCTARQFSVLDAMLQSSITCTISRSADGRFCYLTGLGSFLKLHDAQPGQFLRMYADQAGALTVALQAL